MPVVGLLAKESIDLIILDIGLPDVNGMELCKEIRKNHNLPIIFLTARSAEIDRVVGLEIGADDYAVKPFSPRELCARVKAVLRRTRHLVADQSSSQAFRLNESKRQIFYFGRSLSNLVQNAIDFSPAHSEIKLRGQIDDTMLAIIVEDNGTGIPGYAATKIFNKFFSLQRPYSGKKSTGLGLNFV